MTAQLRISDDLALPLEAVTEPMGMLAARRAGKSNAAVVDLLDYWRGRIGKAERAIVDVIVAAWPEELDRDAVAERSGYSPKSSGFGNALERLRTLGLISGLRPSDDLVDE